MTVRKLPGCIVLGLLASLTAHAALYGGEHSIGGVYHGLVMRFALAAALALVALVAAFAWIESGNSSEGSVLAARLRERLPGFVGILAAAAMWYAGIEAMEPHHAGASGIALIVALAAASYAALFGARAVAGALARAVITIFRASSSPRQPLWHRRQPGRLVPRRSFLTRRRFARPPPIAFA